MFQCFLVILLLIFLIAYIWLSQNKNKNLPPGPSLLALFRNVVQIANFPYLKFMEWANIYGPIMRLKFGRQEMIVLSDPTIIKELFANPLTTGRLSDNPFLYEISQGFYGIINSDGEAWEIQRKFTIQTLKLCQRVQHKMIQILTEYGFGRSTMEEKIMTEVNITIDWFRKNAGKVISGNSLFEKFIINILWNIATGQRCDMATAEQDPTSAVYKTIEFNIALQQGTESGLFFFPFLRHIFPELMGWNRWVNATKELTKLFDATLAEHKENFNGSAPRDFVDHILNEMDKAKNPKSTFYGEVGHKNARALLYDMLLGGAVTVSSTLSWFLLYISHNLQYQKKVHHEIDQVIGASRSPTLNDKNKMPLTEALVMETVRCSSVTPLGFPHRVLADISYKGYFIPKNAALISNIYGVHFSPNLWGDPENFRPERFLSDDGTQTIEREELIAFSEGKRRCIAEKLAKDELFLYISALLQVFEILPEKGKETRDKADFESFKASFVRSPKPFKIMFRVR